MQAYKDQIIRYCHQQSGTVFTFTKVFHVEYANYNNHEDFDSAIKSFLVLFNSLVVQKV